MTSKCPDGLPSIKMVWRFWAGMPRKPGIYYVCDENGNVLYVGKSRRLGDRWAGAGGHQCTALAVHRGDCNLAYLVMEEDEIHEAETREIARLRPLWNINPVKKDASLIADLYIKYDGSTTTQAVGRAVGEFRKQVRHECPECFEQFTGIRTAIYCKDTCRQRARRKRQSEEKQARQS